MCRGVLCLALLLVCGVAGDTPSNWNKHPFVRCKTSAGDFTLEVRKDWAPLGAARFLELVEAGFFTDHVMYRALPGFIVQFGVHSNPEVQGKWREKFIKDDPFGRVPFRKGMVSFAGFGANSRSTHIFIVNHPRQLGKDDNNMHEVPFAHIVNDFELNEFFDKVHVDYGDLSGLQLKFVEEGISVLSDYPDLSVIHSCAVVSGKDAKALNTQVTSARQAELRAAEAAKEAEEARLAAEKQAQEERHQGVLQRIRDILTAKSPKLLKKLPKMLEAWQGKEVALLEKLEQKHGLSRDEEL